jgi:hypothetical protein
MPANDEWDELVVIAAEDLTLAFVRDLVEDFWPRSVAVLGCARDIEIGRPTDEAWFHVRRRFDQRDRTVDLMRLRKGAVSGQVVDSIDLTAMDHLGVARVEWKPWKPGAGHDNAFVSFLQKLSVMRARDGMSYERFLAATPVCRYGSDPQCREAYKVMTCPGSRWYIPLTPWLEYMGLCRMTPDETHEYAHWFGHIVSGWPSEV